MLQPNHQIINLRLHVKLIFEMNSGVYGLKADSHDVTKLIDDHPLNELLYGNYQSPSLIKDKGKKATVVNESFLHSVRKSCSILQLSRPVQSQNISEIDSCSNKKTSPWVLSSVSVEAIGVNGDTGHSSMIDVSSSNKVSLFVRYWWVEFWIKSKGWIFVVQLAENISLSMSLSTMDIIDWKSTYLHLNLWWTARCVWQLKERDLHFFLSFMLMLHCLHV